MSAIITAIGQLVTGAIGWMQAFLYSITGGTIGTGNDAVTYTGSPLLMVFVVALPLVGLGIGLLSRLIKTRG